MKRSKVSEAQIAFVLKQAEAAWAGRLLGLGLCGWSGCAEILKGFRTAFFSRKRLRRGGAGQPETGARLPEMTIWPAFSAT